MFSLEFVNIYMLFVQRFIQKRWKIKKNCQNAKHDNNKKT